MVVVTDSNDFISVPYYTVISFETSHSWLVGMLKARIVVKLYGETGESQAIELKRYLCFLILNNLMEMHLFLLYVKETDIWLLTQPLSCSLRRLLLRKDIVCGVINPVTLDLPATNNIRAGITLKVFDLSDKRLSKGHPFTP